MIDSYTKFILSIIAICLFMITIKITIPDANANTFGSVQDVKITNLETDIRYGETLRVYCTNCN